jgi:hypothetical protein
MIAGAFLYGLSISSAFPTAMHLAEGYVPLTGAHSPPAQCSA